MAANEGLLTRAQALDAGLSPSVIRHLLRGGELVLVRRGVYADGELWNSLDEYRGRHRLRTRAALKTLRRTWVVSHDSSAHEHELDILPAPEPHVHITRPGFTTAWTEYGVKHHLAPFRREQVVDLAGLPAHDVARTAVDIAREHGPPYGEVACDSALRRGASRAALEDACASMRSWPHITRTRRAVAFADPRAESVAETLGRILVSELGVGEVDPQFPVRLEDGTVVWGDLRVGCHIFEVDGKSKYTPVERGGLASRPPHEVVWAEKKRERGLHRVGLGTSRIIWADFWPPQRSAALKRMRGEYADTVALFGPRLPERLALQALEVRGRCGA